MKKILIFLLPLIFLSCSKQPNIRLPELKKTPIDTNFKVKAIKKRYNYMIPIKQFDNYVLHYIDAVNKVKFHNKQIDIYNIYKDNLLKELR